jgi:hypothetical protein
LARLSGAGGPAYADAATLLDDLERAAAAAPPNAAAWERFVRDLKAQSADVVAWRRSA